MRHGKKIAHLGRKTPHRKYMLANMACSLIEHKSINTTSNCCCLVELAAEELVLKETLDSTSCRYGSYEISFISSF